MELTELFTNITKDISILILLGCANFMPIVARYFLKDKFAKPIDMEIKWIDKKPIFGPHKTWRGLAASIIGTTAIAPLLGIDAFTGTLIAFWSMAGDLLASFIKRRLGKPSGAKATGIDQVIESALPLIVMKKQLALTWYDIILIVTMFFLLEIYLSPILYKLKIRRRPY